MNGGWTIWGRWDKCSVSCGGGTQTRSRSCTNPPAAHGGKSCVGLKEMAQDCNKDVFCPGRNISCRFSSLHRISLNIIFSIEWWWTTWGDWSKCSVTCDGGTKTRFRSCTNPPAAHGGKTRVGLKELDLFRTATKTCSVQIRRQLQLFTFTQNRY